MTEIEKDRRSKKSKENALKRRGERVKIGEEKHREEEEERNGKGPTDRRSD